MKLTKIEQQKKDPKRYSLYLDDQFAFSIHEDVLIECALYKGQNLTEEQIEKIQAKELFSKGYQKALTYLSYQIRSIKEVRDYLKQWYVKEVNDETRLSTNWQDNIIHKLKSQGYLDDQTYGKAYLRHQVQINSKGPRKIAYELGRKGLSETDIEAIMVDYSFEEQKEKAQALAEKLMKKKLLTPKKFKEKCQQHLLDKGYDRHVIQAVLAEFVFEVDEEALQDLLEREAMKQYKKRQRKFSGNQLKQKITQDLLVKGHDYQAIQYWLMDNETLFERMEE